MDRLERTARHAVSLHALRVPRLARPAELVQQFAAWSITHCLVFDDHEQLLGVVELRLVIGHSALRVFSDLISKKPAPRVSATAPLGDVAILFQDPSASAVLVYDETDQLLGIVTKESLLMHLLLQQRQMTEAAKRLAIKQSFLDRRLDALTRERTLALDIERVPLDAGTVARVVAHDLLGAATNMRQLTDTLTQQSDLPLNVATHAAVQRVRSDADRFLRLGKNLENLTEVLQDRLPLTRIDLEKMVSGITAAHSDRLEQHGVNLFVEKPLPLAAGHRPTLQRALDTILDYLLGLGESTERRRIRIHGEDRSPFVRIWIEAEGGNVGVKQPPEPLGISPRKPPAAKFDTGLEVIFATAALRRMKGDLCAEGRTAGTGGPRFCLLLPSVEALAAKRLEAPRRAFGDGPRARDERDSATP